MRIVDVAVSIVMLMQRHHFSLQVLPHLNQTHPQQPKALTIHPPTPFTHSYTFRDLFSTI